MAVWNVQFTEVRTTKQVKEEQRTGNCSSEKKHIKNSAERKPAKQQENVDNFETGCGHWVWD